MAGVEGVLQQIENDLHQPIPVAPDGLIFGNAPNNLNLVLPFAAQKSEGVSDNLRHAHVVAVVDVRMAEGSQLRDNGLDPLDALLDVVQNLTEFRLPVAGKAPGYMLVRGRRSRIR